MAYLGFANSTLSHCPPGEFEEGRSPPPDVIANSPCRRAAWDVLRTHCCLRYQLLTGLNTETLWKFTAEGLQRECLPNEPKVIM